jgi:poly(A) polymerase
MKIKKYLQFIKENISESKSDMWSIIPKSVKELHELFQSSGKKLYLVGGSVRDFLVGNKPKDFDLATDALPDEVLEIIGNRYRTNLQGKSFGVVVVYTKEIPEGMEIATFRSDLYDGKLGKTRNPDVKFTTIDQDVLRRDLRVNGLFYDLDKKEIVDLVGGIDDIKNGVIGMIGDPDLRIKEDPLRILRAIRMACRL